MANFPGANSKQRHTNSDGGSQSALNAAYHLLPALALNAVAQRLEFGRAHYDEPQGHIPTRSSMCNWRKIPKHEHINHAMMHLLAHQHGDETDHVNEGLSPEVGHLAAAATRILMALELAVEHDLDTSQVNPVLSETTSKGAYKSSSSGEMAPVPQVPYDGRIPGRESVVTYWTPGGNPLTLTEAESMISQGYWVEQEPPGSNNYTLYPSRHLEL